MNRYLPAGLLLAACTSTGQHSGTPQDLDGSLKGSKVTVTEYVGSTSHGVIPAGPGRSKIDAKAQVHIKIESDKSLEKVVEDLKSIGIQLDTFRSHLIAEHEGLIEAGTIDLARSEFKAALLACKDAAKSACAAYVGIDDEVFESLKELASAANDIEVEIRARTPDGSPLYVYNWTDGTAPEEKDRSLAAEIAKLVEELQAKAKEVKKKEEEIEEVRDDLQKSRPGEIESLLYPGGDGSHSGEDLLKTGSELANNPAASTPANDTAKTSLVSIKRSLRGYLPPGRIEFGTGDKKRGDQVDLSVRFVRPKSGKEPETLIDMREYSLELDNFGWHAEVRPQLIFFRSTDGDSTAKSFKANAAVLVDWAYRFRAPSNCWQNLINGLEPALGLHVASIDQGESSLEIGVGANLSFKQGLVSIGWGNNLSERDHYYFIGGDLFQLVDQLSSIAQ